MLLMMDDPELIRKLAEEQVPFMCACVTPPLCGWSKDLSDSPIRGMIDAGLNVVLNSDDPPMLHTDLNKEYQKAALNWRLSPEEIANLMTNAIEAAWLDDVDRAQMKSKIQPALDELIGGV